MSLDKRIEGAVDTILSCCNSALSDDEKQSYIKQEIKNAYSLGVSGKPLEEIIEEYENLRNSFRNFINTGDGNKNALVEFEYRFVDLRADLRPWHTKMVQDKTSKTVILLDGEQTITDSHIERFGLDKNRLIVYKNSVLENMLDTAEAFSQSEDVGAIIIDSVKSFYSIAVEAKSAEDNHIGIEAKKLGTRFPIINANCARRNIAFIVLNQWRENPR